MTYATEFPDMANDTACCGSCQFFLPDKTDDSLGVGVCRRWPPSFFDEDGLSLFPIIWEYTVWCGEWKLASKDGSI